MYIRQKIESECAKWAKIIEDLLSDIFSPVSVEQINGEMDKHEKFGFITLFTDFLRMVGYDPCVLVVTSAANTLFQEWGCNARVLGMIGRYVICTSWILFVKLEYLYTEHLAAHRISQHICADQLPNIPEHASRTQTQ